MPVRIPIGLTIDGPICFAIRMTVGAGLLACKLCFPFPVVKIFVNKPIVVAWDIG